MANPTALYSYRGQEPQPLPHRIRLSDGTTRTEVSTFSDSDLKDAGFTGPYVKPEYNSEQQTQIWNSGSDSWVTAQIPDEVFWARLRNERNYRLEISDYTIFADSPFTDEQKTAWKTYRQALRDLPTNTADPKNVTWPSTPS